jgi:transcriptional regulator
VEVLALLGSGRAANLITGTAGGLMATMLPLAHDGPEERAGLGRWGALVGHVARNNAQWRTPAIGEAMVILAGPDAYISPAWYATKREHGRVVPTWNYNPAWVEANVRRLTDLHEGARAEPWSVDDAPEPYLAGQLKAIVGVEIVISHVEGKWKLSQNRPVADMAGAIDGLEATGEQGISAAMREAVAHRGT